MARQIQVVADAQALHRAAARQFVRRAKQAVQAQGRFTVALSGGSTPKAVYTLLALERTPQQEVPWDKVHFFWGDERHVPPDHPDSNYRMAYEALLCKVPEPVANVHRILSENLNAAAAAQQYERTLRACFQLSAEQFPRFDLVLLGLGADGHTASLFPGSTALREKKRLVAANWVAKLDTHRITVTAPVFNRASCVIFLVSGEDKAMSLKAVVDGRHEPEQLPAQLIRPEDGQLLWLVDQAAGRLLTDFGTKPERTDHDP